jgi:hypothetical protein
MPASTGTPRKRVTRSARPRAVYIVYGQTEDGKLDVKGLFTKAEDAMILLSSDRALDWYRGELPVAGSPTTPALAAAAE